MPAGNLGGCERAEAVSEADLSSPSGSGRRPVELGKPLPPIRKFGGRRGLGAGANAGALAQQVFGRSGPAGAVCTANSHCYMARRGRPSERTISAPKGAEAKVLRRLHSGAWKPLGCGISRYPWAFARSPRVPGRPVTVVDRPEPQRGRQHDADHAGAASGRYSRPSAVSASAKGVSEGSSMPASRQARNALASLTAWKLTAASG